MPRRQQRLTRPKGSGRKQKQRLRGGDPTAPSPEEWDTMTEFGTFVGMFKFCYFGSASLTRFTVRDEDDEEHSFKKGDT
jgi:hypothetical protein